MSSHLHQSLACQLHRTHPWQVLQTNDYLAESKKISGTQGIRINTSRMSGDCDLFTLLFPVSDPKPVLSKYPLLRRQSHFQYSTDSLGEPASHSSLTALCDAGKRHRKCLSHTQVPSLYSSCAVTLSVSSSALGNVCQFPQV